MADVDAQMMKEPLISSYAGQEESTAGNSAAAAPAVSPPFEKDAYIVQESDACCSDGFSTGLCECTGPRAAQFCLLSFFLPCYAHGLVVEASQGGAFSWQCPTALYGINWILGVKFGGLAGLATTALGTAARRQLRKKYGMQNDCVSDCCVHMWCHACGMAQELRHIRDVEAAAAAAAPLEPATGGIAPSPEAEKANIKAALTKEETADEAKAEC